jgi:hypothetical protein
MFYVFPPPLRGGVTEGRGGDNSYQKNCPRRRASAGTEFIHNNLKDCQKNNNVFFSQSQKLLTSLFLLFSSFLSHPSIKLMNYNLLNYPGTATTTSNPYFREVISSINPDIIAVQEMKSQAGVDGFKNN